MHEACVIEGISRRYEALYSVLNEWLRRQWAAAEAQVLGWGGVLAVSRATGKSRNTIAHGLKDLEDSAAENSVTGTSRLRRTGGGRKPATSADPDLEAALELLVDPVTRGDPQSALRWTCKSTSQLARELNRQGYPVSPSTIGRLLKAAAYSLQSNRKTKEGKTHPDRNAQFEYINATVKSFQCCGQPVISVDTKK